MINSDHTSNSLLTRFWQLACSLKLAIALASTATLVIMVGSLIMHFNPAIFGGMEQETMGKWLPQAMNRAPLLVAWVPLSGLCVILFALNTLFCTIDWLLKINVRWRKTGEYLVHTGFILLTIAYFWGSISGFRSGPHRIVPGETFEIPNMPEYSLRLLEFTPELAPTGQPLDMINKLTLWKGTEQVASATVKINHPMIHNGLVILPSSFGQELQGFRFHLPGTGFVNLTTGSRLPISDNITLVVHELLPNARRNAKGDAIAQGGRLFNPAMLVSLHNNSGRTWQGWYFLREKLPESLLNSGAFLRPVEPIYRTFSLLTINRDPGDKMALLGSLCVSLGVLFAFFSFYRKRARGDRPEV